MSGIAGSSSNADYKLRQYAPKKGSMLKQTLSPEDLSSGPSPAEPVQKQVAKPRNYIMTDPPKTKKKTKSKVVRPSSSRSAWTKSTNGSGKAEPPKETKGKKVVTVRPQPLPQPRPKEVARLAQPAPFKLALPRGKKVEPVAEEPEVDSSRWHPEVVETQEVGLLKEDKEDDEDDEFDDFLTPHLDTEDGNDFLTPHLDVEEEGDFSTPLLDTKGTTSTFKPSAGPGLATAESKDDSDSGRSSDWFTDGDMEELEIPTYPPRATVVEEEEGEEEDFLVKALKEDTPKKASGGLEDISSPDAQGTISPTFMPACLNEVKDESEGAVATATAVIRGPSGGHGSVNRPGGSQSAGRTASEECKKPRPSSLVLEHGRKTLASMPSATPLPHNVPLTPSPPRLRRVIGAVDNGTEAGETNKPKQTKKKGKASEKGKEKEIQEREPAKKSTTKQKDEAEAKTKKKETGEAKVNEPVHKETKVSTQKISSNVSPSTSKQTSATKARVGQVVVKAITASPSTARPSASARPSAVKKKQEGLRSNAASRPSPPYPPFKKHKTSDASSNISNSGSSTGAFRTTSSSVRQLPPPPSYLPAKSSPAVADPHLRRDASASTLKTRPIRSQSPSSVAKSNTDTQPTANNTRPTLPRVNSLPPKPTWGTNSQGSHHTTMATGFLARTYTPPHAYSSPRDRENVLASHRLTTHGSQSKASYTPAVQSGYGSQSTTIFSRPGLAETKYFAPSSAPSATLKSGRIERESVKPTAETAIHSARPLTQPIAALPPPPFKKDEQANADSTSTEHNQALPAVQTPLPTQVLKRRISLADYAKEKRQRRDQS